jgi:hypothetical protein
VKVHLLQPIDGFHDFLTKLKALNPRLEMRGL